MAVINLKDKRYLTKEGDKVILHIDYEDAYDQINIDHMLKSQLKIKKINKDYLDNYNKTKLDIHNITVEQLTNVKEQNAKFLEDIKDKKFLEDYKAELVNKEIESKKRFINDFDEEVEKLYMLAVTQLDAGKEDATTKLKDSEQTLSFWKKHIDMTRIDNLTKKENEKIEKTQGIQ